MGARRTCATCRHLWGVVPLRDGRPVLDRLETQCVERGEDRDGSDPACEWWAEMDDDDWRRL